MTYYGLRDYGTAAWEGGDAECDHRQEAIRTRRNLAEAANACDGGNRKAENRADTDLGLPFRDVCGKCGARRIDRQLGMEATVEEYVENMVRVFREVRRVLRDDGTLWLNMGDSYASSGVGGRLGTRSTLNGGAGLGPNDKVATMMSGRAPTPPGLKPKDLIGIPWRVAFALQADGWWLRSEIIWHKCLSGGAVLYARTQKGEMPATLKDLVRLDPRTVELWDGAKWNQVLEWGDVPADPDRKHKSQSRRSAKYRGVELPATGDLELEFRNGERVGCTREHKWPTQRGMIMASDLRIGDTVPVVVLPEPLCPVMPSALDDTDTGWFVGMYLAEGSHSGDALQFSGHARETERNTRLRQIAEAYHGSCFTFSDDGNGTTAIIHGPMLCALVDTYISGNTAQRKHLHPRCWSRSSAFLQALLQGYLEGDGCLRESGWRLGFTNNDALASDLRTLAARLGYSLRLRRMVAVNTATGKQHKGWRGDLVIDPTKRRRPDGEIVAIRQSRARKFHNVTLAESPHTFALASGICTQNSNPMPESVTDRPTKSHEQVFLLAKSAHYFYDAEAVAEQAAEPDRQRYDRVGGSNGASVRHSKGSIMGASITRNRRSVWTIPTEPYRGAHFATYPRRLVEPCILAGTSEHGCCPRCGAPWERMTVRDFVPQEDVRDPDKLVKGSSKGLDPSNGWQGTPRGTIKVATLSWRPTCTCDAGEPVPCTVLDPFAGSGTTGEVALRHNRNTILIELNPDYITFIQKRLHHVQPRLC